MSNNQRNKRRRPRASDEQENARTITETEFEADGVQTRSATKKSRRNKVVSFADAKDNEDDSEKDELESIEDSSQQQDNNSEDSYHENEETQAQPNETLQQDSENSEGEDQLQEAPPQRTASINSSNDEFQPEETLQQENGNDEGDQRYTVNESRANSEESDCLKEVEKEIIQLFKHQYPDDESYRYCLNRIRIGPAPHRQRKAREPWSLFETFAIEMRVGAHKDSKWMDIIEECPHIFSNRTNVQLKDKARTELKRRQAAGEPLGGFEFILKN